MKNTISLSFAILLVCCQGISGQEAEKKEPSKTEAAPAPGPTRPAVEKYVTELKAVIEKREVAATRMINEIKAYDESIQGAVQKVLEILTSSKDSLETKTKVSRMKEETLAALKKAAQTYAQKRGLIAEELRTTKNEYRREDLFASRGQIDERINKMVDAMVQLALSMEADEGHERYLQDSSVMVGRGGIVVPSVKRNPEYDQGRKQTAASKKVQGEMDKALQSSLERLNIQARDLAEKLKNPGLSEQEKTRLTAEAERIEAIRKERVQQQLILDEDGMAPPQLELDSKEFLQTEDLVDTIVAGARRDFTRMMAAFNEIRAERQNLAALKAKLDHAEKWLENNPAGK